MSVDESWEKIEHWLDRYAPEEAPLPGPCSRLQLDQLHDRIGVRLPEDVEQSLLRHNGSGLTDIIPIGYRLHSVQDIEKTHLRTLRYRLEDDPHRPGNDSYLIVPIAELNVRQLVVDTRTGRLGGWDVEEIGYEWSDDPLWSSLSSVLEFVGNVLASPPPWVARLPDRTSQATDVDPDFPGTLVWTDD
ncbi:hypothetical protein [Streptomyces sp. NPDC059063]|uniref:hypothetical protein n=1 Tax=unclassified Streptomyces TaxID=2593676 RepID=UPI0036756F2B